MTAGAGDERESDGSDGDRSRADVLAAIRRAGVGERALTADLVSLEAVAVDRLADGRVDLAVTLPVPAAPIRAHLEREIKTAVREECGLESVAVRWRPDPIDPGERVGLLPDVTHVIAVGSAKGGVGKSSVAVNLATALADAGASVGLLDADVYGPNAPQLLGLSDRSPETTHADELVPREAHGVRAMSMGFLLGEDDPVIWRGALVTDFLTQLLGDVEWGDLDYLVVDLPPGTGDAHLTIVQQLPVTGAVIVTTPQDVAVADAERALEGFVTYDVPILGVAENMRTFTCDCGSEHDVFGTEGGSRLAETFGVPVLGRLPLDPAVGTVERPAEEPPGIDVPLLGRLQLPRTEREREGTEPVPPIAVREGGGTSRRAMRTLATRTAARANAAAAFGRE